MRSMGEMAHVVIGDLGVALHTDKDPSREEWDAWMVSVRKVPSTRLRVLAVTDGGGPNTVHRNQFVKYLDGAKARIAVVSDAIMVRGIVTALSWFTDGIRIFAPEQLHAAMAHVDMSSELRDTTRDHLREMASSLSAPVRAMRRL
jgi:hypothetical protein